MAMLTRFDLSTDSTAFYITLFVILLTVTVLLARVAPGGKTRARRGPKANDRFAKHNGELID